MMITPEQHNRIMALQYHRIFKHRDILSECEKFNRSESVDAYLTILESELPK